MSISRIKAGYFRHNAGVFECIPCVRHQKIVSLGTGTSTSSDAMFFLVSDLSAKGRLLYFLKPRRIPRALIPLYCVRLKPGRRTNSVATRFTREAFAMVKDGWLTLPACARRSRSERRSLAGAIRFERQESSAVRGHRAS